MRRTVGSTMAPDFGTLILNEIADAVIVTTPEGTVVCWNPAAMALFGYSSAEACGRTLAELIAPAGAARDEALQRTKSGALVAVDSSSKAIRAADGSTYILWHKRDVTAGQVQRQAQQAEARYGGLLAALAEAVVLANAAGRIVLVNDAAATLFGYAPAQLRGLALEQLLAPRLRAAYVEQCAQAQARAQTGPCALDAGQSWYGLRQDGIEIALEISVGALAGEHGTLTLSLMRAAGAGRLGAAAWPAQQGERSDTGAAQQRWLGGLAHDLRTPLNAIIGFSGTMLMKLPGPLTDEQDKQLRTIQHSARALLAYLNDSLARRPGAEAAEAFALSGPIEEAPEPAVPELEPVPCGRLLEQLLPAYRAQARELGLALEFRGTPHEITLLSDAAMLRQIVGRLLSNALRWSAHGEVQLGLSSAPVAGRECLVISVRDSGCGIAPEQQHRLFAPERAGRSEIGSDAGLARCQRLAALLGGQIVCDSQPGVGSTFTLALPLEGGRHA